MESQTELFSITCTSCAAKLKVRQESAIGQVLSCPRCQSMVLVEPPADWSGSRPSTEGIETVTAKESAVMPTADWNTDQSKNRQKVLLLVTCGAVVLLGLIAAVAFIATRGGTETAGTTNGTDDKKQDAGSNAEAAKKDNPFVEVDSPEGQREKNNSTDSDGQNTESQNTESQNSDREAGNSTEDESTNSGLGGGNEPDKTDTNPVVENEGPVDNNQDGTGTGAANTNENDTQKNDPEPFKSSNTEEIANNGSLIPIFDSANIPIFDSDTPGIVQNPYATSENEGIGIGEIYIELPDPLEGEINDKLGINLTGIMWESITVLEFVRTLAEISAAPICFDIDAIHAEGIGLDQELKIFTEDATIHEHLETNLGPLGLRVELTNGVALITTVNRDKYEFKNYQWPIAISVENSEATEKFTKTLQQAINPGTWSSNGGQGLLEIQDGQLRIFQTPLTHKKIERFIYRLDIAKQLMDNPGEPTLVEKSESMVSDVQKHLNAIPTLEIIDPAPIQKVFSKLGKELGIVIVFDWPSLIEEGWNPNTQVPWVNPGRKFGDSLNALMSSMKIGYRWVDLNTLEITSRSKIRNTLDLEVYSINNLQSEKRTLQYILLIINQNVNGILPEGTGASWVYEKDCDAVVALMPQSLHRLFQKLLQAIEKGPAE